MHPIEQLRYVARASGADARLLVAEAASALRIFGRDPAGLLTGCRRLLTRQPAVGPLWWLCTRLVLSADQRSEARLVVEELHADTTDRRLAEALPDGSTIAMIGWPDLVVKTLGRRRADCSALVIDVDGLGPSVTRRLERDEIEAEYFDGSRMAGVVAECDVVVLEAAAASPSAALVDTGGLALAATARALGRPVWLVVPVGCLLPEPYWRTLVERVIDIDKPAFVATAEVIGLGLIDRVVRPDSVIEGAAMSSLDPDCAAATELLVEVR